MKITILGCGGSAGVPVIGCKCKVCKSTNPLNKRTRVSIYVEDKNTSFLIDTSPDLHQQAIKNKINKLDAVLYTHAHADHIMGLDELRSFNYLMNQAITVYGLKETIDEIKTRFNYAFKPMSKPNIWYKPLLEGHILKANSNFDIGNINITAFPQWHGNLCTLGYRFSNIAYSVDTNQIDAEILNSLKGIKIWIVDCIGFKPHPTHAHLDLTLEWIKKVKPEIAILTHMPHDIDYDDIKSKLPDNIIPAHDNMILEI